MCVSSVLVITQVMSPISKEQNLFDAHFYTASTSESWTNAHGGKEFKPWPTLRSLSSVLLMDRLSPDVNSLMASDNGHEQQNAQISIQVAKVSWIVSDVDLRDEEK